MNSYSTRVPTPGKGSPFPFQGKRIWECLVSSEGAPCGLRQEGGEEVVLWGDGRMSEIAIFGALTADLGPMAWNDHAAGRGSSQASTSPKRGGLSSICEHAAVR